MAHHHIGATINLKASGPMSIGGDEPIQTSPIVRALLKLEDKIQNVDHSVSVLVERLHPILDDGAGQDGATSPESPAHCPLEDQIRKLISRLEFILDRVDSARGRLCI